MTFDVLITTYKRPAMAKAAVLSALNQGPLLNKVIVVDDASGDETAEVIRAINDPRIVLFQREKNGGISAARHDAYARADADWTVNLDSDHELLPGALDKFASLLARSPRPVTMLAARIQWDTGLVTPVTFPEGIIDYATRIRWTYKKDGIGADYACAIAKKIYKVVQREPLRSSFPDILFQLDVAKLGQTIFMPDVVQLEKSCCDESWTRGTAEQRWARRLKDAPEGVKALELILQRHEDGLKRWGKPLLASILCQGSFFAVLCRRRMLACRFLLKSILTGRISRETFEAAVAAMLPLTITKRLYRLRG
jgi:glycosyltransferase involved in cell wall biosynthesis